MAFKNILRRSAQKILGFNRYLFLFSVFNVYRIKLFRSEKAFRFFLTMIPADGSILDIGANIGINTVILAQQFPKATIHAFEPIKENFDALQTVLTFFKLTNVLTYNTALGEHKGEAHMIMPQHQGSKMQGWSRMKEDDHTQGDQYNVPVNKLDEMDSLQKFNITAIKIDVENFEYFVLKGGMSLIFKNKPIVFCELWNDERKLLCFELMRGMGYRVMIFNSDRLVEYDGEDVLDYYFVYDREP